MSKPMAVSLPAFSKMNSNKLVPQDYKHYESFVTFAQLLKEEKRALEKRQSIQSCLEKKGSFNMRE